MTRRFQLRPITTQSGFAQTIVLPPAARVVVAEPTPTDDPCEGVAALPEMRIYAAFDACAGANLWHYAPVPASDPAPTVEEVIFGGGALPAGYTLEDLPGDATPPSTATVTRTCDGQTFEFDVIDVGEYTC